MVAALPLGTQPWAESFRREIQLFCLQTDRYIWSLLEQRLHISASHFQNNGIVRSPTQLLLTLLVMLLVSRTVTSFSNWAKEQAVPVYIPCPEEAVQGWKGEILENPHIFDPAKPNNTIQCYDPATGYHLGDIQADTKDSIYDKVDKAKQAHKSWSQSSFGQRRKTLRTILRWTVKEAEVIARVASRDTGKTAIDAAFGEILTTCSKLQWTIKNGEKVLQPQTRPNNLLLAHKICQVRYESMGVVVGLVSWNYPAHNCIGPIIAALMSGNSIILKCNELVAWSTRFFIDAIRHCIAKSGGDPEIVQLVTCLPSQVEHLTLHPDIQHITFIGSEQVGQKVALAATENLIPTTLELGGKDPAVICKSADLKFFTSTFIRSCFQASGQNCIGIERFIVDESIVDDFIRRVTPRIKDLKLGSWMDDVRFGRRKNADQGHKKNKAEKQVDRVDVGAMITDVRFERLEELIAEAVSQGAELVVGGKRYIHPKWSKGHYFSPTLLTKVTTTMKIAREEVFGPVFLIMTFPSGDINSAIELANSTRYGLGSSIFTSDGKEAEYIATRLDAGMVNINDFGVSYLNQGLPFGGVKKSGYGRFAGPEGLLSLTRPKAVTKDRFAKTIKTGIPPPLDYPLKNAAKSWNFVNALLNFAYGTNPMDVVKGLLGLIKNSL